jgi:hypothetical protein
MQPFSESLHLKALRQEYLTLCQEAAATTDSEHRARLLQWAFDCADEFEEVLQQWRATRVHPDEGE